MLYDNVLNLFCELGEQLVFQERRNFFNKVEDKHLKQGVEIVETIIARMKEFEFSYKDLSEVINITSMIIALLNVTEDTNTLMQKMKDYETALVEQHAAILNS